MYNVFHLVNEMCITELSVECCFVCNAISLWCGTWPIISGHGLHGEKRLGTADLEFGEAD